MALDLDALRKVAETARAVAAPVRITSAIIRTRTWSGGKRGVGTATDSDRALPSHTKIREVSIREVARSGGALEQGDVLIGPLTPSHTGGGITQAELRPTSTDAVEVIYVLSGGIQGEFVAIDAKTDLPISWSVTVRKRR